MQTPGFSQSLLNPNVQLPEQQAYLPWCAPRSWAWGGCPQGVPESPGGENGGLHFPPTLPWGPYSRRWKPLWARRRGLVAGEREPVDPWPLLCFCGSPVLHIPPVCAVTRLTLSKHIQEYFLISNCWAVTRCYGCKPLQNRNHVLQAFCSPHCIEHGAECISVCHSVMSNSVRPRGL